MHLLINGEDKQFPEPLTVSDLIDRLGAKGDRVALELNRDILPRAEWSATLLKDGDKLEIVHFVGGGSL
jgi:thiamine biosynthesis protein ThiS